jgi:glycerol-3-phosphate dehydrogenase
VLLRASPHIIRPLRFILPHHRGLRPAWLIRLGLFLYDHLGGRRLLPGTSSVDLTRDETGAILKGDYRLGFEYSDCQVMDSRLVVLNAMDAAARGAEIHPRTACVAARRKGGLWELTLADNTTGKSFTVKAKVLVNASGPWLDRTLAHIDHQEGREHVRMVKGSHIIVAKLFDHPKAYIFQNPDGRIIFAIPWEDDFTLIGTTDLDFNGDPGEVAISEEETEYLCQAVDDYFTTPITPADVIESFSGVRPLFDDGKSRAQAATRDYVLRLDGGGESAPLLCLYGGKITTYRKLAESVLEKLAPFLPAMKPPWTVGANLPGGDFAPNAVGSEISRLLAACPLLKDFHARRLIRTYGTRAFVMTRDLVKPEDLGPHFGGDLYGFEVDYLIANEWARTAEDVLRRRTHLGLVLGQDEVRRLQVWMEDRVQ